MYAENHSAMYPAFGKAGECISKVETKGWSAGICSHIKLSLGALLYDLQLDLKLPQPDIALSSSNICKSMVKSSEVIGKSFGIPHFLLDIPFAAEPTPPSYHVQYVVDQCKDMIAFLEGVTGKTLDYKKLLEIERLSIQALKLWREIMDLSAAVPTPMDALDAQVHILPLMCLRGTTTAVKYYEILYSELSDRVKKGIGAVTNEKYRLLWEYMPIYHEMDFLSRILSQSGAAIVTCSFLFPLLDKGDSERHIIWNVPFFTKAYYDKVMLKALAKDFMRLYPSISLRQRVQTIKRVAERFSIDGIIIHCNQTCKPQSLLQYEMKNIIKTELGIPCLVIEGECIDPRFFSKENTVTRLEIFLRCLPSRKVR
jgi:benzoyl-CoA reductase/2-hydroxyglutaryl-CoA dehydratase subunit BcrC/BadD/HgdB